MSSCLRDVNFNKPKFSFEREDAEAVCFHKKGKASQNDKMQSKLL